MRRARQDKHRTVYRAQDAAQLSRTLAKLPAAFTIVRKHIDLASWFAVGGGLLIAAAVALSLWWNRTQRVPAPPRSADHLPRRPLRYSAPGSASLGSNSHWGPTPHSPARTGNAVGPRRCSVGFGRPP